MMPHANVHLGIFKNKNSLQGKFEKSCKPTARVKANYQQQCNDIAKLSY